jgi:methyl-accepting chemotaxis protein
LLHFFTASLSRRLYGLLALFAVGFFAVVGYQLYDLKTNLDDFKRTELQSVVQAATSVVQSYYDRFQAGELTEDEAKVQALDAVRAMRYQGKEYFFIDDYNSMILIMHPTKPEKQGADRSVEADSRGKFYLQELLGKVRTDGAGFETYLFKMPEGGEADKVSYALGFAPWGWSIASGVMFTQVDEIFWQAAAEGGAMTATIALLILLAGVLIARSIAKPMVQLNRTMLRVADGEYSLVVEGTKRRDEIGAMAKAVEVFRENGAKVAQMTEAEAARIVSDQQARARMMAELQKSFGEVVDAAIAGDFSRRVDAEFPDAELNALAGSVNNLVATVDRGLTETGEVIAALADADLTKRMQGDYEGAFARLKNDTNAMADKLSDIVGQLKETSRGLKTATGEILSGANDLSERTTKQAATIEETSAAMEQLASTVLKNADRAKEASGVAGRVTVTAEEGGKVMGEANSAMERITQSSGKISNIIGLIDDIAFQTNLLALNASVEAARAGDAGKGFAVVAVEVRRLAQSAASASSDVKKLIEQSGAEVSTGSKLVADAANRLHLMLEAARSSSMLMDGIARDSREQASAIEEVTTAVRQLDEMTQHNAALVEETNAAIEQTEAQANDLDRVVDIFNVSGSGPAVQLRPTGARTAPPKGIRGLQQKVKQAASSYLSRGNAAVERTGPNSDGGETTLTRGVR